MDQVFKDAHSFVLKWEGGGKFHKVPGDPGGSTKWGVSFRFLRNLPVYDADINRDGIVTWRDVQALDKQQAMDISYKYFWVKIRLDEISENLAFAMYDSAFNLGTGRATRYLQGAVGAITDGIIGPNTIAKTNQAVDSLGEKLIIKHVLKQREDHYRRLGSSWGAKFLNGWINRITDLRNTINERFLEKIQS